MVVRVAKKEDVTACLAIAKSLPEWFDAQELQETSKDIATLPTFVIADTDVHGFICIKELSKKVIEIKHIATKKEWQNKGLGTALLNYIKKQYPKAESIEVKTLDESAVYVPYNQTRAFYVKNGFVKTKVIDPYPNWGPGNPCAIYAKKLR
jgi:N-acetylglutamate synthase-like GNAT family acetyltransferase